jgi:hypothetical protein
VSGGPVVLAFNHDSRSWRVIYGLEPSDIELDKDGNPKALTSTGRIVVAVVESTNPLFYSAEAGTVTETVPPIIQEIQTFLDKLGPVLVSAVGLSAKLSSESTKKIADLDAAVPSAKKNTTCLLAQWKNAKRFSEHVETRRGALYTLFSAQCQLDSDAFQKSLDDLETAANAVAEIHFCVPEAKSLQELVEMSATDVPKLRQKQKTIAIQSDCEQALRELNVQVNDRLTHLETAASAAAASPGNKALADALKARERNWTEFGERDSKTLAERAISVADAAAKVATATAMLTAEKRAEITGVLLDVEKFEDRLLSFVVTPQHKTPSAPIQVPEVADFFVVPRGSITVAWDKIRSRTLDVKNTAPFDKPDARRPATVSTKYEAESLFTSLIDFNVSLTYTHLGSPVFEIVTVDAATTADPKATKKIVAKTGEEERAGQLALFVALPVFARSTSPAARRFALEIGVGGDTKKSALFLGASWKVTRAIRLGLGRTWQEVKTLDGQTLGQEADAVKQKSKLGSGWYGSFSFSIGSLKLFKAD